jgi:hypothetical protein
MLMRINGNETLNYEELLLNSEQTRTLNDVVPLQQPYDDFSTDLIEYKYTDPITGVSFY